MANIINKNKELTTDIYGINSYVNEIKKSFTPDINEETLLLGIFGYTGQVFSDMIQNSIIMASEFANESIPTKAKFERNIIAHALSYGITDINAKPSQFDVLLAFVEGDIINWFKTLTQTQGASFDGTWTFKFDKDTPIMIGKFEFHTDYDITIRKVKLPNGKYAYTAIYNIDNANPNKISDVVNPNLPPPALITSNGTNYILIKCTLRQVEKEVIYKKIINNDVISSKTFSFEFDGQLANFTVDVNSGTDTIHLTPIYEGLISKDENYCYYSYLDSNTIRIKFDRSSFMPVINDEIVITVYTTHGKEGNFTYKPKTYNMYSFDSEKYGYSGIGCQIRPVTGQSLYGTDKKSIEELKKYIPKETLSRGSITNLSDLENFFNMIDTDDSKIYFYKKRDNLLERVYNSFILMKDNLGNIIPTNTINIKMLKSELIENEDKSRYVLRKKQKVYYYKDENGDYYGSLTPPAISNNVFEYYIPYSFVINANPLYGMHYLSTMNTNKFLEFTYINDKCLYQYIATSVNWSRGYEENEYKLSINLEQNIDPDETLSELGMSEKMRCIAVLYDGNTPVRWCDGSFIKYDPETNIYKYEFTFNTDDNIDNENKIYITGLNNIGSTTPTTGCFSHNMNCVIHVLSEQDDNYGLNGLYNIIPELGDKLTLSNSYTVSEGLDFFYDYSDICRSVVTVDKVGDVDQFTIYDVPVIKYDYFNTEEKVNLFYDEIIKRKNYIDYATMILEDAFTIDMKYFNTYGPSRLFTTDEGYLDKVNINLNFRIKLATNHDTNIINDIIMDIKEYVENINEIKSLYIPKIVSSITNKYGDSIIYFEFRGINNYGPGIQSITSIDMPGNIITPEFVNIHNYIDGTPSIMISLM